MQPRLVSLLLLVLWAGALGCTPAAPAAAPRPAPAPGAPRLELVEASIPELQAALAAGRVTSSELVARYRARIAAYDTGGPKLNAISVLNPQAADEARERDAERAAHRLRGPLHGIPIIVKDNYETAAMQTAAGSRALAGFIPGRDAFLVTKLKAAGAIIIAKANMDELGLGVSGQGSLYGQTRNPYALDRSPGGSSSGPAVAVAASFAAAALGSDTCGSIRLPAANTNLVGLRGTQGLLSRTGIVPLGHTQDMGAPIGRSVTDVAILLDALVGYDPADAQTAESVTRTPPSYAAGLDAGALRGARIGLVTELLGTEPETQEVAAIIRRALTEMAARGAEIVEVSVDNLHELSRGDRYNGFLVPVYELKFDLAAYFATFPDRPAPTVEQLLAVDPPALPRRWLEAARTVASLDEAEYKDALLRRDGLRRALLATMAKHRLDALAYPVYRLKPVLLADKLGRFNNNCVIGSNSGLPSIAVPAGWTDDGLPVGLELLGRAWSEARLLGISFSYEQATHHRRRPSSTP